MKNNLFEHIPAELAEEFFETLQESGAVKIERIVSRGHATPDGEWYDQPWDEWVVLLSGSAVLEFAGERTPVTLCAGDYLLLPSGCVHRVAWTEPDVDTLWLAVHFNR
ncbi:cupin domain-containing protein [Endozoicomonas sp. SCSIO W0465]|uniref:cupin domain-containing protein n=1 Tax=Endozoicomonas sp. SCSIO W0465 TaxID=2918516 RepID=UPI00207618E5|nr:cupin domain-containing protein [Endozoicomonas sp. SCSIO W0465]USE39020.1 cupin domain-containing protein [Endozoicomonas sp. SCSIO W0465]